MRLLRIHALFHYPPIHLRLALESGQFIALFLVLGGFSDVD